MLLSLRDFAIHADNISKGPGGAVGMDFETDGLRPFSGARAFILGFTNTRGDRFSVKLDKDPLLPSLIRLFFSNPRIKYCAHNAKFELGFLHTQFDAEVMGEVWDSEVNARIEKNNYLSYSLQACAERIGESKYKPMLEWLKQRGNKNMYHKAPDELIVPYVEQDAWLSWKLRQHQVEVFKHWDVSSPTKIKPVVQLEKAVLPHLFDMERHGLLVDVGYCNRGVEYEKRCLVEATREFEALTSVPFVDSRKTLQPIFGANGIHYGQTELGNASFTEDSLKGSEGHSVVAALLRIRRSKKRLSTYWEKFLEFEHNGIIHPSINQNRATTGRMSISDPSCQNWSTDEEEDPQFPVRRAFIAHPGCVIVSMDYSQMELRKSADEAEDLPMIKRIQEGADLHQEVADIAGVLRSLAKNGRFAKQYGARIPRIAQTLGVSERVARTIADAIDEQGQKTAAYSYMLQRTCKPYGMDWLGRRFYFDPGFEYKAFNYRIQGGCAEILKLAICEIGAYLKKYAGPESFMVLPVHDELLINMAPPDMHLLPEIKRIMIAAHRDKKLLDMDVSVESGPNMFDLEKYGPAS